MGMTVDQRVVDILDRRYKAMNTDRAEAFAARVLAEVDSASAKHAPMNSLHEAYAVILEEMDELWDECKRKRALRDHNNIHLELKQIAAMAVRAACDLGFHEPEGK